MTIKHFESEIPILWSLCGIDLLYTKTFGDFTSDKKEVTCKRCLKSLKKLEQL